MRILPVTRSRNSIWALAAIVRPELGIDSIQSRALTCVLMQCAMENLGPHGRELVLVRDRELVETRTVSAQREEQVPAVAKHACRVKVIDPDLHHPGEGVFRIAQIDPQRRRHILVGGGESVEGLGCGLAKMVLARNLGVS